MRQQRAVVLCSPVNANIHKANIHQYMLLVAEFAWAFGIIILYNASFAVPLMTYVCVFSCAWAVVARVLKSQVKAQMSLCIFRTLAL